jgi:hypothetical protein
VPVALATDANARKQPSFCLLNDLVEVDLVLAAVDFLARAFALFLLLWHESMRKMPLLRSKSFDVGYMMSVTMYTTNAEPALLAMGSDPREDCGERVRGVGVQFVSWTSVDMVTSKEGAFDV